MAINAGTVLAYLDLDTGKFSSAMQMAQSQMSSFAQDGGGMTSFIDGVGAGLTTVGRAMTMGISVPLVGAGLAISRAAISWESAFADVRKTVNITSGETEAGFKRISDGLYAMSEAIPVSKEGLASIAAHAGQLGVAEEYILSFTRVMADLEVATNLTGDEAAAMFAQYANITGMDIGQIENLGSVIVELGNNTATTERDIAEMMHRLAGAGSIVGLTDAQIAGLGATLTSLGINAEAGGSAMSRVLSEMDSAVISNGKDLKKFASIAGVSSKEFAAAWNADPISALQLFTKGLGAVSEAGGDVNSALAAVGLSDIRITDMLKRLMGSGDLLTNTVDMANAAWKENNALSEEAAKRYATVESKLSMLKNAVGNVATQFGDVLMPIISKAADLAMKGVKWVSSLSDGTRKMIVTIGGITAAIGPVLLVSGKLISAFSGVIPIAAAVAGAVALVYKRSERLQAIVGQLKTDGISAFNGLKVGVTAYREALAGGASTMDAINKGINSAFGAASSKKITGTLGKIVSGFQSAGKIVRGTTDGLGELIASLIDGEGVAESLRQALSAAFGSEFASGAESAIGRISTAFTAVQSAAQGFALGAASYFSGLRTSLSAVAEGIAQDYSAGGVLGVLTGLGERLGDLLKNGASLAREGAIAVRDKVAEGLAMAKEWLAPKAQAWMTSLGEAISSAKAYVTDKLPDVKAAILDGLMAAKETITTKAQGVMTWIGEAYRSEKVQALLGDLSGVGSVILGKIGTAKDALITKAGEMLNALGTALGSEGVKGKVAEITGVVATIAGKIASNMGAWKMTAFSMIGDLIGQLTDNGFLETAVTGLGGIVTAIANGIGSAAGNIISCATTLASTLLGKLSETDFISNLFTNAADVVISVGAALGKNADSIATAAKDLAVALLGGLSAIDWATVSTALVQVSTNLVGALVGMLTDPEVLAGFLDVGVAIANGVAVGVASALQQDSLLNPPAWGVDASAWARAFDPSYFGAAWANEYYLGLQAGLQDGSFTAAQQMALAVALIGEKHEEQLAAMSPSLAESAKALFNDVYAPGTFNGIRDSFAQVGFQLTDSLVLAISTGEVAVSDALRALGIGMNQEMILSMSSLELKQYLNDYFTGVGTDVSDLLQNSASDWGKIFGQAIPEGATAGLENGMYVLRSKTDEVIKMVSAVDAEAAVKAGNKGTAEAGMDALKSGIEGKEDGVTTAATTAADNVTAPFGTMPETSKINTDDMMAAVKLAIEEGTPAAVAAINTATEAVVDAAKVSRSEGRAKGIGMTYIANIGYGITSKRVETAYKGREVAQNAVNAISSVMSYSAGYSIGTSIVGSIISGVGAMAGALASRMSSLGRSALSAFRSSLQMFSPSRLLVADGMMMGRSVAIGADRSTDEVVGSMVRLAGSAQDAWDNARLDANMTNNSHVSGAFNAAGDGGFTLNFYGDITVREEADIHRISAEIYGQFRDELRGRGY